MSASIQETQMFGQFARDLSKFARLEAERIRKYSSVSASHRPSTAEKLAPSVYSSNVQEQKRTSCSKVVRRLWDKFVGPNGEDLIFLTLLGSSVALISFVVEFITEVCHETRMWIYESLSFSVIAQYLSWVCFGLVLICFAVGFTHIVAPSASGSGIPEIKSIMRGVALKDHLSLRTLIAKVIALTAALGSGLPIGKEAPFIHIASGVASVLSRIFPSLRNELQNRSRQNEILAAGVAVGVACVFAAPFGGVLFSFEVSATYFALTNYWRGLYASISGVIVFRFLAIWFYHEETLTPLFKTNLRQNIPFHPYELIPFAVVGILGGYLGAFFVLANKHIVLFVRSQKRLVNILQKNRFIYPAFVTVMVMTGLFPAGLGQFWAGALPSQTAVTQLFDNTTWWNRHPETYEEEHMLRNWRSSFNNIFGTIILFTFTRFWMIAFSTTLAMPCGTIVPAFIYGAGLGRLIGEAMSAMFPDGVGGDVIVPGGYAIIGAAACASGVTHTVSMALIVLELTGQLGHLIPCMLATILAKAAAASLSMSFYDAVILLKKLPLFHLKLQPTDSTVGTKTEEFMLKDIKFLTKSTTYKEIYNLLLEYHFRYFPLVESAENRLLLGAVPRTDLEKLVGTQLSDDNKYAYFLGKLNQLLANEKRPNGQSSSQETRATIAIVRQRFTVQQVTLSSDGGSDTENEAIIARLEKEWQDYQMNQPVCLDVCDVDPAPFQIVAKTSLYQVHSLFSRLSLHFAFVTESGKLVGIISLTEIAKAIETITANEKKSLLKRICC